MPAALRRGVLAFLPTLRRTLCCSCRGQKPKTLVPFSGGTAGAGRTGKDLRMEHIAAVEERIVSDRLRRKLEEVNVAAREQLAPLQDHVNFTLQQAYFKCAYECFDRGRRQEDINNCVEHCSVPVLNANNLVETEMAKFQERMQRALMVCQDRFEEAKLQQIKTDAMSNLESCVDHAIQDSIQALPRVVDRLKASFSLR